MNRIQGQATTITSDQAKGGYAPERRPTPPILSTPHLTIDSDYHPTGLTNSEGERHIGSGLAPIFLFAALFILSFSCTKKPAIQIDVPVQDKVEEVVQVLPEEPSEPAELNGVDPVLTVVESEPVFKPIYFDFDKAEIRFDAREELETWRSGLYRLEGAGVVLEGHCDSRGSVQYNFGLGQKRAVAVKRYLEDMGVKNRIRCVSFGESRLVQTRCKSEDCFQENRRVELRVER